MKYWPSRRIAIATLLCCLVVVFAAVTAGLAMSPARSGVVPFEPPDAQAPPLTKVRVHPQPHVPLAISVDTVNAEDPRAPAIEVSLENLTSRTVRAFAIRY